MRYTAISLVLLALLTLTACQLPSGQPVDIGPVIRETVATIDRNQDGLVTNRELKDSKNDPMAWITLVGGILGAFGLVTSQQAKSQAADAKGLAKHVAAETDEQWDILAGKKPG